jgi:hypothetical protein
MTWSFSRPELAIVLAAIDARATVRSSVARFLHELDGQGELVVVDASRDGTADVVAAEFPGVRLIRRLPGRLAPELWRDGLEALDDQAPLVAFSTAQMVPAPGWRRAMIDRLEEAGAAAVGGPIDPPSGYEPGSWATYLHRYVNYLRPLNERGPFDPPGDNAVYRRDCLERLEALWDEGFWEVEIHRALRAGGETLAMAPEAVVVYHGGAPSAGLYRQRYAHARRYGASRARSIGAIGRLSRMAAAPAVPAVLLRRIAATLAARGQSLRDWFPALPYLFPLLAVWSLGEAHGMGTALLGTRWRRSPATSSSPTKRFRRAYETQNTAP